VPVVPGPPEIGREEGNAKIDPPGGKKAREFPRNAGVGRKKREIGGGKPMKNTGQKKNKNHNSVGGDEIQPPGQKEGEGRVLTRGKWGKTGRSEMHLKKTKGRKGGKEKRRKESSGEY